jgi:hypothetical protein
VTVFETLLRSLGDAQELPPSRDLRGRLREAPNLLAEHRDERVLYWRLTGLHTPHVTERYTSLGLIATGSIDSEIVGLSPFGVDDETEIAAGLAIGRNGWWTLVVARTSDRVGSVGGPSRRVGGAIPTPVNRGRAPASARLPTGGDLVTPRRERGGAAMARSARRPKGSFGAAVLCEYLVQRGQDSAVEMRRHHDRHQHVR